MMSTRAFAVAVGAIATIAVLSSTGGCGSSKNGDLSGDDGSSSGAASGGGTASGGMTFGSSGASSGGDGSTGSCDNGALDCMLTPQCTTSISGTVYDPGGKNPLYNVVVYVPDSAAGTLSPITVGTNTCSTCDVSIGNYLAATTSDASGHFSLTGVPAGSHIPLVVQIGKWRREVFLDKVTACQDNALTGSTNTRLPAKQSEGNIPEMAVVTGGADQLGCFLQYIGLDSSEYSAPSGTGRLHVYQGQPSDASALGGLINIGGAPKYSGTGTTGDCTSDNANCVWHSKPNLEKYDIVLLACEGDTYDPSDSDFGGGASNKTTSSKQALHDWLDEGGKVFATHFHYTWFKNGPADFQALATWNGSTNGGDDGLYNIDTTFLKGSTLSSWLKNVNSLTGTQIQLSYVAESVGAVNQGATRYIYNPQADPQLSGGKGGTSKVNDTKYMSVLTPVGGIPVKQVDAGETNQQYCGKAVFSDLHVGGPPTGDIPASCSATSLVGGGKGGAASLTAQLNALEFLFFDLSACVSTDTQQMTIPPPTR
jgi:hypothetical protein